MRTIRAIVIVMFFVSCRYEEPKSVRKQIEKDSKVITWYYYNFITSRSPDIITVKVGSNRAKGVILDVNLTGTNIILKTCKPPDGMVSTKDVEKLALGYNIVFDSLGSYDDLKYIPDGIKQNN